MTTILDLAYVALFAVALPLWDNLVFWPAFYRQSKTDPARALTRLSRGAIGGAWALVAVGAALWVANERSWTSFGFSVPDGWRLWTVNTLEEQKGIGSCSDRIIAFVGKLKE